MIKGRIMLASAAIILSTGVLACVVIKNPAVHGLLEIHSVSPLESSLSRLGIDATTQPYKSGTDALGGYYIYLDRDNIPVTLRPADGGYIVQHQVGVDTREEIIRLAKLLFGEDVVCEIPSMYEDTLEVTIHGDVFIYENGTLERVPR